MSRAFNTGAISKAHRYTSPIKVDKVKIMDPGKIRNMNALNRRGYGRTQGPQSAFQTNIAQGLNPNFLTKSANINDIRSHFYSEVVKIAENKTTDVIKDIMAAFKAEGGALGMKALYKRVKAPKKLILAALDHLKEKGTIKQHPHGDLYTPMEKGASKQKLTFGEAGKDFVAGIDPFGTFTTGFAAKAQRRGLSERQHNIKKGLGTIGGVVGGATIVPSTIYGLISGAKGLSKGKGLKRLSSGAAGFLKGSKEPMSLIRSGIQAKKAIRLAEQGKALTKAQKESIRKTVGQAKLDDLAQKTSGRPSMADVRRSAKDRARSEINKRQTTSLRDDISSYNETANKLRGALDKRMTPEVARKLSGSVSSGLNTGLAQLGLGGAVGAYGAYSQYGKGRAMERDTQKRINRASRRRTL